MTFSEKLKKYKKENDITQEEMAARLGISVRMYQYYEKGDYDGSEEKTRKYLHLLSIPYESKKTTLVEEGTPIYELSATASKNEYISQLPEVPAFRVSIPGYEDCNFGMHVYGHSMYPTI